MSESLDREATAFPNRSDSRQLPALEALQDAAPASLTYHDLATRLGVSTESARWAVTRLLKRGLVQRHHPTDNTRRARFSIRTE